jgi:hypothetical protein
LGIFGFVGDEESKEDRIAEDVCIRGLRELSVNGYDSCGMASLEGTPGMGEVQPPTRTSDGSGDVFPALTAGTGSAKKGKKKSTKPLPKSVLDWETFRKNMLKSQ